VAKYASLEKSITATASLLSFSSKNAPNFANLIEP
jgi:hypothetical protein